MAVSNTGKGLAASPAPIALRDDHLPQALELSRALKWPYRLEDWQIAHRLGRGFAVEDDGRLIGTGLWWPYGERHASVGMIIVAPSAQRRGIGRAIMDAILADAAGRTIILNSTEEGLDLYTRLGFVAHGHVLQHQTVLARAPAADDSAALRRLTHADFRSIENLDMAASGMDRRVLVDALLETGSFIGIERAGRLSGYACVRTWGRGVVIGPVVAADAQDARSLIAELAASHVGNFVRIDVTFASDLSPWLSTIGLPCVGRVVAMTLGTPPERSAAATLFALSNQSLG